MNSLATYQTPDWSKIRSERILEALRKKQLAREGELRILEDARTLAQPIYVIGASGFWLSRWRGGQAA